MEREITITDNFMFATVMQNEGICRPFLERMLGIGIEKSVYLEREKDCRSTRLRTCAPNTRGCR